MTKAELITAVSHSTGLAKEDVSEVLTETLNQIKANIGEGIYIRGFGSFTEKTRKQKVARNITAGTSVIVPEHQIPFFKPAPDFKQIVKQ